MAAAREDLSSSLSEAPASFVDQSAVDDSKSKSQNDFSNSDDFEYGFQRPEMNQNALSGTVDPYDCHLFLCYKNYESWPARVEGSESDRLPRLLAAALKSRKKEIQRNTRLTICEGRDGTESSNGDVLIFPDMIKYRGLTHFDVDSFVEDVLVKGGEWASGKIEALMGSHVFVCCHGSRDRRCGVCGPALVKKFQEEIESRGLKDQVFVSPCSHIGGHKYAGNLITFTSSVQDKVTGHWYGYVSPDDVPILLDQHIGKGEIVDRLWRGQMGLSNEEQRLQQKGAEVHLDGINNGTSEKEQLQGGSDEGNRKDGANCCQGANGFSCCRDENVVENKGIAANGTFDSRNASTKDAHTLTSWFKKWEQSDIVTALAVIGAVASVTVAYSIYRRSA
ncbi:hypothetical protein AAC387_Pa02g2063 [Persea americana]